ncbi:hypothetical protein [Smaragdicoccus niigatensis]|uniref:hypothetical protein n=1 Tax=Smaragdicoccus niigatensis TaxID=359359 RepID=UPI00037EC1AB|nr:hypothetical protein [Smaragdicoccus niigatensis]
MALTRDQRFPVSFGEAFPLGLVLVGDIGPDTEFQPDRTKPAHQRVDEITGLRIWKAAVMDPSETKAKRASFEMFFLAEVQPVPAAAELMPGIRPIELEGLTAQPKVMGQGEFKYQGFVFRASGVKQTASSKPATAKAAA